jgi:hypothetical protein
MTWPLFTPGKDPVPILQEAGWAPGPVWTGAENLAPPPELDPRIIQPVASHYTDYATRPSLHSIVIAKIKERDKINEYLQPTDLK